MDSLTLKGDTPIVQVTDSAHQLRREILTESRQVVEVKNTFDQAVAAESLTNINKLTKEIEAARKDVKSPVLELGRDIDSAAKVFNAELVAESRRVGSLLSSYMEAERVKADQARRRAEEEQRKILAEQELKERKAMEAAKEDGKFIERHEKIERETAERLRDSQQNQVVASAPKPEGVSLRQTWKYEIIDIGELAKARPELVTYEPNRGAINAIVKAGARNIPGVRIYSETTTITK